MQIEVSDYKVKLFLKLWGGAVAVLGLLGLYIWAIGTYIWAMGTLTQHGYFVLVIFLGIVGGGGLWAGVCALVESPPRP